MKFSRIGLSLDILTGLELMCVNLAGALLLHISEYLCLKQMELKREVQTQSNNKIIIPPTSPTSLLLQQPLPTVLLPTVAVYLLAWQGPHLVAVVPAQLSPGWDKLHSEECQGGKPEVMPGHEHILDKCVGVAAVVEVPAYVTLGHGVHDEDLLTRTK